MRIIKLNYIIKLKLFNQNYPIKLLDQYVSNKNVSNTIVDK